LSILKIKSLAKDSLIYGVAGIISRMISIFLVPVYTRIFQPSDYGIISLINTTFFLVNMLAICALDNSAARWYYESNHEVERKKTIASWFWFQLGLSLVLLLLLVFSMPLVSRYLLNIPVKDMWLIWLLPCCTLLTNILPTIIWNWYRFNRKPKATIIFTLSQSLLTMGLTILFVVFLKFGITGVYAALFISSFLFSAIAIVELKDWIAMKYFDRNKIRQMLVFALPLIPAALGYWLINSTDAYFLQFFRNKTEVGLFSVGASLASGVALFTGAFQQAWSPFAFSIINEPDSKTTYANVFLTFGIIASIINLGMFLFTPELLMLLTSPQYYNAAWVASILSLNIILVAFGYIASIGTGIVKNNKYYSIGILLAAVVTVVLDIILIPHWGKEGSAIATVVAQLIVPVYLFYHAQRLYPVPYQFGKVVMFLLGSLFLGLLGRYFTYDGIITALLIKSCIIIFFVLFTMYYLRQTLVLFIGKINTKNKLAKA
jgi:O-antigen/teichoic acid export membrane protein